jgi:hypothetical protein
VIERTDAATGTVDRRLTVRKSLSDLAPAKASADAIRKALKGIASDDVRALVEAAFEARLLTGRSPQAALAEPVFYPAYGTRITKVRLLADDAELATAIYHGTNNRHVKHLRPAGYAYLDIHPGPQGRSDLKLVTPAEALRRPRRAPDGVTRFYKGDTVTDTKDGQRFVVAQILADGGGQLCLVRQVETRPYDLLLKIKRSGGTRKVGGKALLRIQRLDG